MASDLTSLIRNATKEVLPDIIRLRRDLHQHPELSFQESRTSAQIKSFLDQEGISYMDGWAGHGIVATIKGSKNGLQKMLRADMDALPIHEANEVPYKSIHDGVMHACGHDVHSASLMGVGTVINKLKDHLRGTVQLIFQPGEEKLPGGASIMLREGLFSKHDIDWIAAQHVFPSLPAGHVGFRKGLYMASSDEIYITVIGKGGHAATPQVCIDPIPIAARIVSALQELISRTKDPLIPAVLTIGKIYSHGGATNVIPDKVSLEGTLRALDETWRFDTHERIRELVISICKGSGADCDLKIEIGYPCLKNDDTITELFKQKAIDFLGKEFVHDLPLRLTSEDFAFYSQEKPATFYRLGTGYPGKDNPPVHSNLLDINEEAIETGIGLMAYVVLSEE